MPRKADRPECDRCGAQARLKAHRSDRTNDGKGTPMRAARYCDPCTKYRTKRGEPEEELAEVPTMDELIDALGLVHVFDPELAEPIVAAWTDEQKVAAETWAASEVAIANDHGGKRLPMPDHVEALGKKQASAMRAAGSSVADSIADEMMALPEMIAISGSCRKLVRRDP